MTSHPSEPPPENEGQDTLGAPDPGEREDELEGPDPRGRDELGGPDPGEHEDELGGPDPGRG